MTDMDEFAGTLEEFKQATSKFLKRCDDMSLSHTALEGAKSALAFMYLGLIGSDRDRDQAAICLRFATTKYIMRLATSA